MDKDQRIGVFFVTVAVIAYSCVPIFGKLILNHNLPALDLVTWRFAFAMPLMWLIIAFRNLSQPQTTREPVPRLRLLGLGALLTGAALTSFWSMERIATSTYLVLFFTYPAMVAVISSLMGERLQLKGWIALVLTLLGIVCTVPDFLTNLQGDDISNFALALLSAAIVAVYFLWNAQVTRGIRDLPYATAWTITGAFLPLLLMIPLRGLGIPEDRSVWLNLLGLAAIGTVISIFTMIIGIKMLGASRAAIFSTAELPLSVILAVILLGDVMYPAQVIGAILVLISIVLVNSNFTLRWPLIRRPLPETSMD